MFKIFEKHEVNPATCGNADETGFQKADLSLVTGQQVEICA